MSHFFTSKSDDRFGHSPFKVIVTLYTLLGDRLSSVLVKIVRFSLGRHPQDRVTSGVTRGRGGGPPRVTPSRG